MTVHDELPQLFVMPKKTTQLLRVPGSQPPRPVIMFASGPERSPFSVAWVHGSGVAPVGWQSVVAALPFQDELVLPQAELAELLPPSGLANWELCTRYQSPA